MRTANLFLKYEIERKVAGGTGDSLRAICATLKSEGSDAKTGALQVVQLGASRTSPNNGLGVIIPLLAFRLNPTWVNSRVLIQGVEASIVDNASYSAELMIVKNPVFSATYTPTWVNLANSSIQYQNNANTTVFPTTLTISSYEQLIHSNIVANQANAYSKADNSYNSLNFLGSNHANTPDIYCLAILATVNSITVSQANVNLWEQL